MWDLPRPGLEPVSPALAGRFSTTAPPGKPYFIFYTGIGGIVVSITAFHFIGTRFKRERRDFLGGAVVKNLPAIAGDRGLIPGLGRSHMPQSN